MFASNRIIGLIVIFILLVTTATALAGHADQPANLSFTQNGNEVTFNATVGGATSGNTFWLEVEVKLVSETFDGLGTYTSGTIAPCCDGGGESYPPVVVNGLPPGDYKWRAQVRTASGGQSGWVDFNGGASAFIITASSGPVRELVEVQFLPGDNRINSSTKDRSAPVAIYCMAEGVGVIVINPVNGQGSNGMPDLYVSYDEIESAGVPTESNLLLDSGTGMELWRLTTGEFQLNTYYQQEWKNWVFVWDKCPNPTSAYHLEN